MFPLQALWDERPSLARAVTAGPLYKLHRLHLLPRGSKSQLLLAATDEELRSNLQALQAYETELFKTRFLIHRPPNSFNFEEVPVDLLRAKQPGLSWMSSERMRELALQSMREGEAKLDWLKGQLILENWLWYDVRICRHEDHAKYACRGPEAFQGTQVKEFKVWLTELIGSGRRPPEKENGKNYRSKGGVKDWLDECIEDEPRWRYGLTDQQRLDAFHAWEKSKPKRRKPNLSKAPMPAAAKARKTK